MGVFHEMMAAGSRVGKVQRQDRGAVIMGVFHEMMAAGSRVGKGWGLFLGQHTNPVRAVRRKSIKAAGGIRQFKKARHG